jgi:hypothetical protein
MRANRTSGSMRRGERRVMVHSANGHRTRKGGNGGAPPDLDTTALALHSTVDRSITLFRFSDWGYQAMGFPVEMFPVLFAIPRTSGWLAQWREMMTDPEQKIARPRQLYVGSPPREFTSLEKRAPENADELP